MNVMYDTCFCTLLLYKNSQLLYLTLSPSLLYDIYIQSTYNDAGAFSTQIHATNIYIHQYYHCISLCMSKRKTTCTPTCLMVNLAHNSLAQPNLFS